MCVCARVCVGQNLGILREGTDLSSGFHLLSYNILVLSETFVLC